MQSGEWLAGALAAARRGSQRRVSILRLLRRLSSLRVAAAVALFQLRSLRSPRDVSRCAPRRPHPQVRRVGKRHLRVCANTRVLTGTRWREMKQRGRLTLILS